MFRCVLMISLESSVYDGVELYYIIMSGVYDILPYVLEYSVILHWKIVYIVSNIKKQKESRCVCGWENISVWFSESHTIYVFWKLTAGDGKKWK